MSMMNIGKMCVRMHKPGMPMRVAMRFTGTIVGAMRMLMMLIMNM